MRHRVSLVRLSAAGKRDMEVGTRNSLEVLTKALMHYWSSPPEYQDERRELINDAWRRYRTHASGQAARAFDQIRAAFART
ncbi:hypothetical protein D7Y15_26195 [Corallococcus sp. AB030]|uniref:hypothetical protein n=1 Tax=Corallococcus sp. AB030 TaxID=2316716 RepID=UPI000ED9B11F|nr:hypothetical protein [Corallococcus sp. AB030]RKI08302.1 hypothetical protein D7Y15_26195 [Corallococcus sp. AB030]